MNETLVPPIEPMLAKLADGLPAGGGFIFEPKWDGFRAIVFRTKGDVYIQSRDLRPLDRYFPELHQALVDRLPEGSVVDGEIVIATPRGARLRCAPVAAPSGCLTRRQARQGIARVVCRLRSARNRRKESLSIPRSMSAAPSSNDSSQEWSLPCISRP